MYKNNITKSSKKRISFPNSIKSEPKELFIPIDQTPVLVGHKNKFGWPMSDIQLLMACSKEVEQSQILSRMRDLSDLQDPRLAKMSDEEKLRVLKPSWVQSPSEVVAFAQYCAKNAPRKETINKTDSQTVTSDVESKNIVSESSPLTSASVNV